MKKLQQFKTKLKSILSHIEAKAKQKPFLSLGIVLGLLLAVIALSNYLQKPQPVAETQTEPKLVQTYAIGEAPRVELLAQVSQSQVVTVVSLSGGVVKNIPVQVGQTVYKGQTIAQLSTDYYGNNASWVQKELAQTQYNNVIDTYDTQKDIISKQKELAQLQADNANELRQIANDSIAETKELLELNESMLLEVDLAIQSATTSAEISQLTAQKAQLLAGITQIRSGLRQAQYQGSDDEPAFKLSQISKDMTLKQIETQEKALEMSKTISELQLKLASIAAATMFPGTPVSGTVERIFVQKNQVVNPGTPIATIKANTGVTQLVARVSQSVAQKVSISEPTTLLVNGETIELYPDHVSTVATEGSLYTITYTVPAEHADKLVNTSQVVVSVPLGAADTTTVIPYLPLESIHQSELESTVFVLDGDTVTSKQVELGSIDGRFIQVTSGLTTGDQIIVNRDVIEGEKVRVQ